MIVSRSSAEGFLGKKLKGLGGGKRSFYVLSEDGSRSFGGPYTKEQAKKRLGQVEYFKHNPERKKFYIHPNESAKKIARRALDRRKELPKSKRGGLDPMKAHEEGIGSGVLRARDIASGKRINAYQVKAFFDRHRGNYLKAKASRKKWGDSKALQAWDLWGGEPLRKQVEAAVRKDRGIKSNPATQGEAARKIWKAVGNKKKFSFRDAEKLTGLTEVETKNGIFWLENINWIQRTHGGYRVTKNPHENPSKPFLQKEHNWNEVLIAKDGKKMTRRQILNYYKRNEKKIWRFLRDQTVMVIIGVSKNDFVRRRHAPDGTFIKLTKLKGIDDPNSFEYWICRRTIEFHPTLTAKTTPLLWVDLDMHTTRNAQARKKLLAKMKGAVPKLKQVLHEMGVRNVHLYSSGTAGGLHLEGDLSRRMPVEALRRRFTKRLAEVFVNDPVFTTGIAKPGQIRLDTTTLHKMGSLRAPYSLTVMGAAKKPLKV